MIRPATLKDLDNLVALENEGFSGDRISRRSYRYLLTKGHAIILVDDQDGNLRSSCVLLFRQGSLSARLYSIVVALAYRGQGLAKVLVTALEKTMTEQGYKSIFLEVREDNTQAIMLYQKQNYEIFGMYDAYYDDNASAIRMRKTLSHGH
jgi:ribosomal protein S18 acetylase RimI-like enzyme